MATGVKFFSKYWRAIAWSVLYIFIMWVILRCLFNFDMFSVAHLVKLANVELHGFAGLVFGILILAAIPLYVATTVLTVRNKSLPIRVPLPNCFNPPPEPVPEPAPEPLVVEQDVLPELHPGIPTEMRESFMRARKNYGMRQMSVFNRPNGAGVDANKFVTENLTALVNEKSDDKIVTESTGLPIPTDFDIDVSDDGSDVPVFSDINFDDDSEIGNPMEVDSDLQEYLNSSEIKSEFVGDLIITGDFAIAVHDDDDFWAPDDNDWFAPGRQKSSPIAALMRARDNDNKIPVFLIEQNNIMDFETNVKKWRDDGIIIVTSRAELIDVIKKQNKD